jgi:hypothetical protein
MAYGKRSDPKKIAANRALIPPEALAAGDASSREESTWHLLGRAIVQEVQKVKARIKQRQDDSTDPGAPYGGRPTLNGALVGPGKRKRNRIDNSA